MKNVRRAILDNIHTARDGETFTLASGRQSHYYVNLREALLRSPETMSEAAYEILKILPTEVRGLGGVPTGGLPLLGAVLARATLTGHATPFSGFYTRLQPNPHGRGLQVEGAIPPKGTVSALIEDTVTTGKSIVEHARVARAAGIDVRYAVAIFDREEGASANLLEEGILLLTAFRARDFDL